MCIYDPENELAIDGNIIVSREIYTNGRNSCKVNGRLVTVSELKKIMQDIIDIHGQNTNQTLLDDTKHINYLDNFIIEKNFIEAKNNYKQLFNEYNSLKTQLKNNYGDEKEKQRKLDLLKYQLNEINDANLKINEENELEQQRKVILNSEKIVEALQQVDIQMNENIIEGIDISIRALSKIENLNGDYKQNLDSLKTIYYDLQEIGRNISEAKNDIDFDEEDRQELETRLDLIYSLKRKYGNDIKEILEYKEEIEKEIETIENSEEYIEKLKKELQIIEEKMNENACLMHKYREKHAKELEVKINKELYDLEMKNAKFKVDLEYNKEQLFNKNGLDNIKFLILTNAGEEYKALSKTASGGEISRIMLAIKTVLSDTDKVSTMVFDEVDTGISGKAAKAVSQKMKKIAQNHQLFVVTHLAVIAATAKENFYIYKEVEEGKTNTKIKKLNEEEIINEVARIATGEITKVSLEHARELRKCG